MRTSFRKCPHALIHRTVQFCRVCITSYHTKTMDPDTTIPVLDYSSKKEEQLLRRRVRERARRAAETAEEKEQRLSKRRARDKARRAAQRDEQHAEQRKTMLQQLRRQQQERRDAESSKQREDRLQHMRDQEHERRDAENSEQRENRLQHMRDQDHQRRDVESSEQRENRLQHMRDQEHQRRDVESSEQRENRLQHMRDQEHERRDAEDLAQRDSRLQRLRESRQRQPDHPQIALFDQPAVRAKMLNFHMSISTIEVPLCLTCLESFPGLTVSSDECNRCHRDSSFILLSILLFQPTIRFCDFYCYMYVQFAQARPTLSLQSSSYYIGIPCPVRAALGTVSMSHYITITYGNVTLCLTPPLNVTKCRAKF